MNTQSCTSHTTPTWCTLGVVILFIRIPVTKVHVSIGDAIGDTWSLMLHVQTSVHVIPEELETKLVLFLQMQTSDHEIVLIEEFN